MQWEIAGQGQFLEYLMDCGQIEGFGPKIWPKSHLGFVSFLGFRDTTPGGLWLIGVGGMRVGGGRQ